MSDRSPARRPPLAFTWDDFGRLAARIKQLRAARGWKQRELSRRAGIAADRLSRLERGAPIRVDELVALSDAFGLGIDELMFAPPGGGAPDELDQLARQVRTALPPEDVPALIRLLQALAAGLRARWETEPKGDRE
ncbi:MAG TPA: helix-turn-helix domain-containing protein [Thermoanaerobaculia bacterium]|nr:helix-turn-helix domain-containing protein [Thermoanaerobaculia bacterium]